LILKSYDLCLDVFILKRYDIKINAKNYVTSSENQFCTQNQFILQAEAETKHDNIHSKSN